MPGGDRTGPLGMGPMTGRAAGFCAGYPIPGYLNPVGGRGLARGFRGGRRGRGYMGAYGINAPVYPAPYPPWPPVTNAPVYPFDTGDELDMLRKQAEHLAESLEQVKERIGELESKNSKTGSKNDS